MRTAFITGATSGIGREFARYFAGAGYALIITGRRVDRLKEIKDSCDVPVKCIAADLADEKDVKRLLSKLGDVKIDVFINNAGLGMCGAFSQTDADKELHMIHVNDIAMHLLFKEVLKRMDSRGRGYILNVASSAGLLPGGPYMAAYYASKAYVVSLTRAVACELKESRCKVKVSALCPGPVDTEFNENADVEFALKGISAAKCVRAAIDGMKRGRTIIIPEPRIRAAVLFGRLLPQSLITSITGMQQKKKRGNNSE